MVRDDTSQWIPSVGNTLLKKDTTEDDMLFYYWLATFLNCATYQVTDAHCELVATGPGVTVEQLPNSTVSRVCWPDTHQSVSVGCRGIVNSYADVVMLQTTPDSASGYVEIQSRWEIDCSSAEFTVTAHPAADRFTLLFEDQVLPMLPGTRETRCAKHTPMVWMIVDGDIPRRVLVPSLDECVPVSKFKWNLQEHGQEWMVGSWVVVLLCYYAGIINGVWRKENGPAEIFHSLLLVSHVAILKSMSFTNFAFATLCTIGGVACVCVAIVLLRFRRLSPKLKRGLNHAAAFGAMQAVFLVALLAMDR